MWSLPVSLLPSFPPCLSLLLRECPLLLLHAHSQGTDFWGLMTASRTLSGAPFHGSPGSLGGSLPGCGPADVTPAFPADSATGSCLCSQPPPGRAWLGSQSVPRGDFAAEFRAHFPWLFLLECFEPSSLVERRSPLPCLRGQRAGACLHEARGGGPQSPVRVLGRSASTGQGWEGHSVWSPSPPVDHSPCSCALLRPPEVRACAGHLTVAFEERQEIGRVAHLLIRKHPDIQGLLMTSDAEMEPPGAATLLRSIPVPAPLASAGSCPQLGHLSVVCVSVCVSVLPAGRVACPRGRSDLSPWRGPPA